MLALPAPPLQMLPRGNDALDSPQSWHLTTLPTHLRPWTILIGCVSAITLLPADHLVGLSQHPWNLNKIRFQGI